MIRPKASYTLASAYLQQPSELDIDSGVVPIFSLPTSSASDSSPEAFVHPSRRNYDDLRLHVKPLPHGRLNLDALRALSGSQASLDMLNRGLRYVEDPTCYSPHLPHMSRRRARKGLLTGNHTALLLEYDHVEPVHPRQVRCWASIFGVPEYDKGRIRAIQDTHIINELCPDAPRVYFTPLESVFQLVHSGPVGAAIDFTSFYPQIPLHPEVRNFHCMLMQVPGCDPAHPVYQPYRMKVAPTGQKHIVYTAVSITNRLLDFPLQGGAKDAYIDNVLFVGPKEGVVADLITLRARCESANCTVNENIAAPELLVSDTLDYRGVHLDFTNKTVSLTPKTIRKLHKSWDNRGVWSNRGFAAHVGLLWWAAQVLSIPVATHFNFLRFVSRLSLKMLGAPDAAWDQPIRVPDAVMTDMARWTFVAIANAPRLVRKRLPVPDVLACVDASADGWGYTALDTRDNAAYRHGAKWTEAQRAHFGQRVLFSTFTEPQGVLHMVRHLVPQLPNAGARTLAFRVGTDSVTAAATFRRGYSSHSLDLNNIALAARSEPLFRDHQWTFVHIAGTENSDADALSRRLFTASSPSSTTFCQLPSTLDDAAPATVKEFWAIAERLRRLLGANPMAESP